MKNTYYNVGKLLIEAQGGEDRAKYGDGLIKEYSLKLSKEIGKKYNITTLKKNATILSYNWKRCHTVAPIKMESLL